MAHKKAGGSSRNGRDSESKRLGVKRYGGQAVSAGEILVRQEEQNFIPDKTLVSGKIILFLQNVMEKFSLIKKEKTSSNL